MNMMTKKRSSNNWCKMHSPDRERNRLVGIPSTMQKRELEDVYYKLLNNNLELKKTVNDQKIEIKLLTTKVRRMTGAHRSYLLKDPKDCCENARSIIESLNKYIEELQTTIEHKNDRIRSQNMKLCSTKQFLAKHNIARSSLQANVINSPYSVKHHTSVAHSTVSTRSHAKSHKPSSHSDLQGKPSTDAETYTEEQERTDRDHHCANNKCTTVKGELNDKIYELHEELKKINDEYKTRMADLEHTTQQLRTDISKERAEKKIDVNKHIELERDRRLLRDELNVIEAQCADLRTQLVMEQKRVFELEMQLKSAELSNDVAKTIEMHFANRNKMIEPIRHDKYTEALHDTAHAPSTPETNKMAAVSDITLSPISPSLSHILAKSNDDSGFTDQEIDDKITNNYVNNVNADLQKTINDLQNELRELKLSRAANEVYLKKANTIDAEHHHHHQNDDELTVSPKRDLENVVNNVNMTHQSVTVLKEELHELKSYSINDLQPKIISFEQCYRGEDNSDAVNTHVKKDLDDSTVILEAVHDKELKNDNESLDHRESNNINEPIASSPILQQNRTHIGVTKDVNVRVSVTDRKRSRRKKSKHRVSNKQAPSNSKVIDEVDNEVVKANKTKDSNDIKKVDQRCTDSNQTELVAPSVPSPVRSQHTYVLSAHVQRPASPNDTEYEISSIVDTPRKSRRQLRHLSPGEKLRSRYTSSSTCDTSSYLSDGEVRESTTTPTKEMVPSIGETKDDRQIKTIGIGYQPIKVRMDDALQSISTELVRCRQLLRAKSQTNVVR